jgi:mono/diheme cytochrome c family protein
VRRHLHGRIVIAIAFASVVGAMAQGIGPQNPPPIARSLVGKDSFEFYCASCHGRDGSGGRGPAVDRLKVKPPDLRLLAQQNGGEFPRDRVLTFVTNGDTASSEHRSSEMPAWGRALEGVDRSEATVKTRIANMVQYVESLQLK